MQKKREHQIYSFHSFIWKMFNHNTKLMYICLMYFIYSLSQHKIVLTEYLISFLLRNCHTCTMKLTAFHPTFHRMFIPLLFKKGLFT